MDDYTGTLITATRATAGTALVVIVPSSIAESDCDTLLDEVTRVIQDIEPRIAIDCGNLGHISSAMLGTLLRIRNRADTNGGAMALFALPDEVKSVIQLTRLDAVFMIADAWDDALARLARSADV